MDPFLSIISKTSKSTFATESERLHALEEAKALVTRLETPWERIYKHCWIDPVSTMSMKVAKDLNLFNHLDISKPKTSAVLGENVGADPALLRRILRVLVKTNVIEEVGIDTYIHTEYSQLLTDPDGLITGIDVFYDNTISQQVRLPEYFRVHEYRNPCDGAHPPFKWIEGTPEFEGDRWEWLKLQPGRYHRFNKFLSALRQNARPWTELYDLERILGGWDGKSALLVDVGGGYGRDICAFAEALEEKGIDARIVLQDRSEVIDAVKEQEGFPKNVELVAHNFFEPNPIMGAKAYFLHSVIHDWPDEPATKILQAIKSAMKPGYSKLLLMERVLPERASEWSLASAAMDINMMNNFAALERTESQWRTLIEDAGLSFSGCVSMEGPYQMVEAELRP